MPDSEENGRPSGRAASGEEVEGAPAPPPLDPEIEARREAAFRLIRPFGDPVLRSRAGDVTRFDDSLREEVARMDRLMGDALGLGLAATQVGVLHRLFVYRAGPRRSAGRGCEPGQWSGRRRTRRPPRRAASACRGSPSTSSARCTCGSRARDEHGEPITIEASGLEARVIQHEMDHLDGVLILDHATRDQRKEALRVLRGGEEHVHDAVGAGDTADAAD